MEFYKNLDVSYWEHAKADGQKIIKFHRILFEIWGKKVTFDWKTQKYKIVQKVSLRMWITIFEYEDYDGEVRN